MAYSVSWHRGKWTGMYMDSFVALTRASLMGGRVCTFSSSRSVSRLILISWVIVKRFFASSNWSGTKRRKAKNIICKKLLLSEEVIFTKDTTDIMDSTEVLPTSLRFNTPPTLPQARSYKFRQNANDNLYPLTKGQTIQIDIPRLQRSYLEKTSTLQFDLTVTCINDVDFDLGSTLVALDTPGGYSLIDVIEVYDYLGSTLLERLEGVSQLMAFVMDTSSPEDKLHYSNEESLGTVRGSNVVEGFIGATLQVGPEGPISGQVLNVLDAKPVDGQFNFSMSFALPLYSFLGLLSEKLVPLHNGFTLVIKLNSMAQSLGITNVSSLSTSDSLSGLVLDANLTNVCFSMDILELGPTAESLVLSANGDGPLVIHAKSLRHYSKEVDGSSSGSYFIPCQERVYNWPINFNASSVTSVFWFMRPFVTQNDITRRSISHRIRNNLYNWSFKYGSSTLPEPTGISCSSNNKTSSIATNDTYKSSGSDCYIQLLKSRNISRDSAITQSSFNHNNYDNQILALDNANVPTYPLYPSFYSLCPNPFAKFHLNGDVAEFHVAPVGRFACGLSTRLVDGRTISGLNTNGMATSIEARFAPVKENSFYIDPLENTSLLGFMNHTGSLQIQPFIADIYMEYDAFVSILPNISTNVSF